MATSAVRRSTTAARLRAVFGDVDQVDAFTGMVSEPHVDGTEFGELQLAMWTRQFEALRDGDRFFYGNDVALDAIAEQYGIDYRRSLADVIAANTDVDPTELAANVFLLDTIPTVATTPADGEAPTPSANTGTGDETATDANTGNGAGSDRGSPAGRRSDPGPDGRPDRDRPRGQETARRDA